MNTRATLRLASGILGGLAVGLTLSACTNSAVVSGVAVGQVGQGVSAHSQSVPQGAQVCAMREALEAPPGGVEKNPNEVCKKAMKSDRLWRRSMVVLGAHARTISAVAAGGKPENVGRLEAALTGVDGPQWTEADEGDEPAARDAAAQLVNQMATASAKNDLSQMVRSAAPHVKTLCDGLDAYLQAQVKTLSEVGSEFDKKRAAHATRRCFMLENKTICVSESVVDRMVYANVFGQIASLQTSHLEARDDIARFCAAHRKLEEAAVRGQLDNDATVGQITDAVKSVPRSQLPEAAGSSSKPTEDNKSKAAAPEKK